MSHGDLPTLLLRQGPERRPKTIGLPTEPKSTTRQTQKGSRRETHTEGHADVGLKGQNILVVSIT